MVAGVGFTSDLLYLVIFTSKMIKGAFTTIIVPAWLKKYYKSDSALG
jgi:hypothetical protein